MEKSKIQTKNGYDFKRINAQKTIGERLRELREQKELTQKELSQRLNITRNVIGRWERNEQNLDSSQIELVCKFFEISCETLIHGTRHEHVDIKVVTGLDESWINWLKSVKISSLELMEIINQVLSDTVTATLLFECVYIYAKLDVPKSIVTEQDELVGRISTYLSNEEALLTSAMTEQLSKILTKVRNDYSGNRLKQTEEAVQADIEKFVRGMDELKRVNADFSNQQQEDDLHNEF